MDFNAIAMTSGTGPLPSLMYVDFTQPAQPLAPLRKRPNKMHVSAACVNCKKAHLACDVSRPCNRCVTTDKADSCRDIQHKKRGRPKMLRDSNNNKIRPPLSSTPPSTANVDQNLSTNNRTIPLCPTDLDPSSDMMAILLSMDLCCARVSDKSLDYLELYPQEFSHRSLYDFLAPGEDQQILSKVHRFLLDNAVQHIHTKLPSNLIRSSYEPFFSSQFDTLLVIANGSLTLKQKLRFRRGHDHEQVMHCCFYLGGGFGADLFEDALDQLYIVCIMTPSTAEASLIRLPPLMTHHPNDSSCSVSPATVSEQPQDGDDEMPNVDFDDDRQSMKSSTAPTAITTANKPPPVISNQAYESNDKKPLLDKFRYNSKSQHQQFIHPHELYYLKTTSSRLSSEAIARTASPYLSHSPSNSTSGPLSSYNSRFSK